MARDHLIHVGSVAFEAAVGEAEVALSAREGLQDVHFVRSGPCTEFPTLTRYVVEVHGGDDPALAKEWMDRVVDALAARIGPFHRCSG